MVRAGVVVRAKVREKPSSINDRALVKYNVEEIKERKLSRNVNLQQRMQLENKTVNGTGCRFQHESTICFYTCQALF